MRPALSDSKPSPILTGRKSSLKNIRKSPIIAPPGSPKRTKSPAPSLSKKDKVTSQRSKVELEQEDDSDNEEVNQLDGVKDNKVKGHKEDEANEEDMDYNKEGSDSSSDEEDDDDDDDEDNKKRKRRSKFPAPEMNFLITNVRSVNKDDSVGMNKGKSPANKKRTSLTPNGRGGRGRGGVKGRRK